MQKSPAMSPITLRLPLSFYERGCPLAGRGGEREGGGGQKHWMLCNSVITDERWDNVSLRLKIVWHGKDRPGRGEEGEEEAVVGVGEEAEVSDLVEDALPHRGPVHVHLYQNKVDGPSVPQVILRCRDIKMEALLWVSESVSQLESESVNIKNIKNIKCFSYE